jgi:Fe2+ transport system protein FeoA
VTSISLAALRSGTRGRVARVTRDLNGRAERLAALGVTPGATINVLQTFPVIVFECDQTEIAIERALARAVLIDPDLQPMEWSRRSSS